VKALVNAKEPGGVSAASCALRLGPFWEGRYEPAENALPPETYDVGKKKAVQNAYEKACCDAKTFTGEYFAKSLNPLIGAEYAEIDVSGGDFGLLRLIEVGQEGLNMQTPAEWTDDKIQELLARELLRLLGRDSIGSTRLKFSFPDTSKSWTDKRYQRITETKELIKGFSSYFASNRNKYKWETVYHSKLWGIPETLFTRIKEERFGYFVASMEGDTLHIELKRNSQSS